MSTPFLTLRPLASPGLVAIVAPNGAVLAQVPRDQAQATLARLQAPPKAALSSAGSVCNEGNIVSLTKRKAA